MSEREKERERDSERENSKRKTERERDGGGGIEIGGRDLQLLKDLGSGIGAGAPEDPQLGEVHG